MKVGVVASSVTHLGGGVVEAIRGQCVATAQAGVEVHVFAPQDGGDAGDPARWDGVQITTVPAVWTRFAWAPSLKRTLVAKNLDVVHLHGLWNAVSYSVLGWAQTTGCPVIISPHGMLDVWSMRRAVLRKKAALSLFERRSFRNAACFHALNWQEAAAIRLQGVSAPIAILSNGVDLPISVMQRTKREGRRTMLYLGRLHPKKGLAETLRAWAILKKRAPTLAASWQLVIAGWGDEAYIAELQLLVSEKGLSDDVTFLGPLFGSNKERSFQEADAFVLASHSEGLPMAVLEAWSFKLPVLMTEYCNLPVGFEVGAAQRISTRPDAIAQTFVETLGDVKALAAMGQNGYDLVAKRYTWTAVGRGLAQTYVWLGNCGSRPIFVEP